MAAWEPLVDMLRRTALWVPVFACVENYLMTVKMVSGRSMYPTFNERGPGHHDAVVLDRWSARKLSYSRGDVIVMKSPNDPDEMLTKRVVGLPGDCVKPRGDARVGSRPIHVPRGQLWVEGDNEQSSNDSNSFGAVATALVEARVFFKVWPPHQAGPVKQSERSRDRLVYRAPHDTVAIASARSSGMLPWQLPAAAARDR